eukprot:c38853_g1_i1 orf=1-384(-)
MSFTGSAVGQFCLCGRAMLEELLLSRARRDFVGWGKSRLVRHGSVDVGGHRCSMLWSLHHRYFALLAAQRRRGQTDFDAYASLLRRCGNEKALIEGKCLHALIVHYGNEQDPFFGNLLLEMYGKCGAL